MLQKLFVSLVVLPMCLCASEGESQLEKLAMGSQSFPQRFTGQVKGTKVRMRLQPDLDSTIVRELGRGELLLVSGESSDYYAVQPPEGTKLYVYRTFVLDNVVEGNHVNVRLEPDLDAPIVAQLDAGMKVATQPCPGSKWLAIDPPKSVQFYVAKDYVENLGGPELALQHDKRIEEVGHLLNSAYMLSQAELRQPFDQIDMEKVRKSFEKVVADYRDLPEYGQRAQAVLDLVTEIYEQKRSLQGSGSQLAATQVQMGLEQLERQIALESGEEIEIVEAAPLDLPVQYVYDESVTDKMRLWDPVEESIFHLWADARPNDTMESFYEEQALDSQLLSGIVEPYQRPVQNRPGDYVLLVGGRPAAYLYSTEVNLEQMVGQQATLQCLSRPNNNFAFPAYFVLSTE